MSSNMVALGNAVPASNTCSLRAHPFLASSPICSSELLFRVARCDPMTKYLPQAVWHRHMHYLLNKAGAVPQYPVKGTRRGSDGLETE